MQWYNQKIVESSVKHQTINQSIPRITLIMQIKPIWWVLSRIVTLTWFFRAHDIRVWRSNKDLRTYMPISYLIGTWIFRWVILRIPKLWLSHDCTVTCLGRETKRDLLPVHLPSCLFFHFFNRSAGNTFIQIFLFKIKFFFLLGVWWWYILEDKQRQISSVF